MIKMVKFIDKPFINNVLGAVAGGLVEGTGIIDYALDKANVLYSWDIRDADGSWIWGVGTGDALNAGLGVLMKYYAKKKDKKRLNNIADGYISGIIGAKMGELYPYFMKQYAALTRYRRVTTPSTARPPAQPPARTMSKYVVTA